MKQILVQDLETHAAVVAWAAATSSVAAVPESIHVLRERTAEAIYLLPGLGPGGACVVAKRAPVARTGIERLVFEQILSRLPLSAPCFYGSLLNEPDGWLFEEHVGVESYSRTEPAHLTVAAHWLGTLHATASALPAARLLPDAGPARYLKHLRGGCERILRSLDTFCYAPEQIDGLRAILARCAALEARWDVVETACEGAPATVVHGDFQSKNVFLRLDGGRLSVLPIDWETAGWGCPAADLADLRLPRVDLAAYWTVVREYWPDMDFTALERLAATGRLLSGCAEFHWKCAVLLSDRALSRASAVIRIGNITDLLTEAAEAIGPLAAVRR